jgi:hypothetical protein
MGSCIRVPGTNQILVQQEGGYGLCRRYHELLWRHRKSGHGCNLHLIRVLGCMNILEEWHVAEALDFKGSGGISRSFYSPMK